MPEQYTILGGKVHIYKRPNSSSWQGATYLAGKNRRTTAKEDSLSKAKEIAEDWYLQLRGTLRSCELKSGKQFWEAAELYLREFDIITQGKRSLTYARGQRARTNGHLVPFFGNMLLLEITAGKVDEYRIHRLEECNALRGNTHLRNYPRCPEGRLKYWMGHAGDSMSDRYDKIRDDLPFRLTRAEQCGVGSKIGSVVPNVPRDAIKYAALNTA